MTESNYSLKNANSFNKHLNIDTNKVIQLYSELIIQYFNFITENKHIKTKNLNLLGFIILRGLDTITNVFSLLLYYTKNVDVAYFHSQKSFYFYVEFIGQISEDENMFLQLSSRDASVYVYKKTIYEVNLELKENLNIVSSENEINNKLYDINFYVNLYKTFLYKIIQNNDFSNKSIVETLQNIYDKLNNSKIKKNIFIKFDALVDKLFYKISDTNYFFEIILQLINKINKNTSELRLNKYLDKILTDDFNLQLNENDNYDKFLAWFFN